MIANPISHAATAVLRMHRRLGQVIQRIRRRWRNYATRAMRCIQVSGCTWSAVAAHPKRDAHERRGGASKRDAHERRGGASKAGCAWVTWRRIQSGMRMS